MNRLTQNQIDQCLRLPLCTQRTGLFLQTPEQLQQMVDNHARVLNGHDTETPLPHHCNFACDIQHTMVDIIKARNEAIIPDPPDDFDYSPSSNLQIRIRKKEVRIPHPIRFTQHSHITPVNLALHIVLKVFCIQPLLDLDRRSISMFNFIQRAKHIKPSPHTWENVIRSDHSILKLKLPSKFAHFFKILKQDKRRPRVGKNALTSSISSLQNN